MNAVAQAHKHSLTHQNKTEEENIYINVIKYYKNEHQN